MIEQNAAKIEAMLQKLKPCFKFKKNLALLRNKG